MCFFYSSSRQLTVQFLHFAMEYLLNLKLKKFWKNKNEDVLTLVQYLVFVKVIYTFAGTYYLVLFTGFTVFRKFRNVS